MVRFLHTADWQLGMTRHFFSEGVQERYTQSRFDAIRRLGNIARDEDCKFMLVCGDAFESNLVDRRTVARTCEALRDVPVPVYIFPANHDPLNAASVYLSSTFSEQKPDHVFIINDFTPQDVTAGVEIVGAPWMSKRPVVNPLDELLDSLSPNDGKLRIVMGHGIVDQFTPDKDAPSVITVSKLEVALSDRKADFIALGDRHSATKLGASDRIWYSGTPVATDFREDNSGKAIVVELDNEQVTIQEVAIGDWDFVEMEHVELNHADDVSNLDRSLQSIENKELTVVRLRMFGGLTLSLRVELQNTLQTARDLFAGFDVRDGDLVMMPEDTDFADLGFSGFANRTVVRLETAEASLSAKNPEKIKALAETAESTLKTIKTRRDAAQTELTEVQTRLKLHGEEGLHEKLQSAKNNLETIASINRSLFRRAAAAKLLYEIICHERDKARQAYVAPLKDRVERLGRLVFDESVLVEIDANLQITARTSGGIRVPFDSLSGGTKEQLSLIFRLACSMIVAKEGGMPLIMDDALGYTDPERLRLMGAVLAKAAKECQIVIFTCVPDRYGNIGAASIVSL